MAFALVFIGLMMIVTGVRNTHEAFGAQVQSDFTGPNNFITWIVAIGVVGALGYIKTLQQFSTYFMALIIIGLVLSNRGFFDNFTKALAAGPTAPTAAAVPSLGQTPAQQNAALGPTTPANAEQKIKNNQTGPFGSVPSTPGMAKAFGWLNSIFGLSSN